VPIWHYESFRVRSVALIVSKTEKPNRGCTMVARRKCVICGVRPANGSGRCHVCGDQIDAVKRRKKATDKPVKFLTYRGIVVGLYPESAGKLRGRIMRRNDSRLPKCRTINLNQYCDGFTRETIKRFKAACLQLARA